MGTLLIPDQLYSSHEENGNTEFRIDCCVNVIANIVLLQKKRTFDLFLFVIDCGETYGNALLLIIVCPLPSAPS